MRWRVRTSRLLAPLLLLVLAATVMAELTIDGPTKVDEYTFVKLQAKGAAEGSGYTWQVFDSAGKKLPAKSLWKQKDKLVFVGPAGTYSISLMALRLDPKTGETVIEEAEKEITIAGAVKPVIQRFDASPTAIQKGGKATLAWSVFPPQAKVMLQRTIVSATGTLDVTPQLTTTYVLTAVAGGSTVTKTLMVTVSDTPPVPPVPPPSPAPIPVAGFRVLVVYETSERPKYPPAQSLIIDAKSVRDYLNAKCAPDPDVPTWKSFRMWDKDQDTSAVGKMWQDAMQRPRASVPWVIISNHPTGGYEGPLPANVDEMLALLRKYGGS